MELPDITHLQYLVLDSLTHAERPGRLIRTRLSEAKVRQSGPAFYRMMARIEDAGLADGFYVQEVIEGQIIKERHYRLTEAGRQAWDSTRRFYRESLLRSGDDPEVARA